MQYTLMQESASAIPLPEPIDFQMLPEGQQPEGPNLHTEHHTQFKNYEIQEANKEVQ